ncbi:hypothetical protein ACLQ2S_04265 [Micromonospora sp. DT48]|uniref:hypothetical protein n=1 Tax=Micromonospora sp. DT48 TaxID=3393429 RepID=UPI003CF216B9
MPRALVVVSGRSRWSYVIVVVPVSGSVVRISRPRWSYVGTVPVDWLRRCHGPDG